jgi:NAD(P)-dependent dehydrogenase (short-subunit alcohol dehydrogenase family)
VTNFVRVIIDPICNSVRIELNLLHSVADPMALPRTPRPSDGVAWITGASSGIGAGIARALVKEGWTVIGFARRGEALAEVLAQAQGPGRFLPWPLDVTDADACRETAASLIAAHGVPALAILNAGIYVPDTASTFEAAAFRQTINVNLMGVAHCLEAVLPAMTQRGWGQLVLVSSVAGYSGLPLALSYGASKAALINLAEALRLDAGRLGVKIQLICPGFVKTPLTDRNSFPMPFLVPLEDAVQRILVGLTSNRFEITFPRRLAWSMKLLRCLPYPLYFWLIDKTVRS